MARFDALEKDRDDFLSQMQNVVRRLGPSLGKPDSPALTPVLRDRNGTEFKTGDIVRYVDHTRLCGAPFCYHEGDYLSACDVILWQRS